LLACWAGVDVAFVVILKLVAPPRYGLAADIPYEYDISCEYDGSKFQMIAPEPNPKRGGVMRYGILNRPPHFDVHQSGTVGNIGTQVLISRH
jgi:hypothetical protein